MTDSKNIDRYEILKDRILKHFLENQNKNFMKTNNVFCREFDSLSDEIVVRVIEKNILIRKSNLEV